MFVVWIKDKVKRLRYNVQFILPSVQLNSNYSSNVQRKTTHQLLKIRIYLFLIGCTIIYHFNVYNSIIILLK